MAHAFIVLEGIDGSGKETQRTRLEAALKKRRQPFFVHKYPTERAALAHAHLQGERKLSGDELFASFVSDLQADQKDLAAHHRRGWVLADRYCLSTAAYQGVDGQLDARIERLEALPWIKPDIVLWLDVPVDEAMRRKAGQKTPDRHEADRAFLEKVRANYAELFRRSFLCSNWRRIDASQEPDKVAEDIRKALGL